ncbi:MAG TPA: SdrD B-like domain-containing protein [Vicinamibacterales bacterium]|jgi:hypothetical protein
MITTALALAAVVAFARPAAAQPCPSAGEAISIVCGTVWNDLNGNGIQEPGEPGIPGKTVTVYDEYGMPVTDFFTNPDGTYNFDGSSLQPGTYTIAVKISSIGTGVQASPNGNGTEFTNSDGVDDTAGRSVAEVTITDCCTQHSDIDFGFFTAVVSQPGTGTPGYWKNHPNAWPAPYTSGIKIGGVDYSKDEAIAILSKPGKDKRATMFSSLLSAMLNVAFVGPGGTHNDDSCVATTITAADGWMTTWGVPNTNPIVAGSSQAWADGEPLHKQMDAYNNGLLCAPHRN